MPKVLISIGKDIFNKKLLKALRLSKPYSSVSTKRNMSKPQLARVLGCSPRQLGKYESETEVDRRIPKLSLFRKACLYFQIDPKQFLNLVWVDERYLNDDGEIYLEPYENEMGYMVTRCPRCKGLIIGDGITSAHKKRMSLNKKMREIRRKNCNGTSKI